LSKATFKKYFFLFLVPVIVFSIILEVISVFEYVAGIVELQKNQQPVIGAEMIVVLAGSSGRIKPAYDLMIEKNIPVLFVAGTHSAANFEQLAKQYSLDASYKSRIVIDNVSRTTLENAQAAQKFVEDNRIKNIILVTSIYHMERAEFLFRKMLEDLGVQIIPYSTYIKPISPDSWWKNPATLQSVLSEFFKYQYYKLLLSGR